MMLTAKEAATFFAWLSCQNDEEPMSKTRLNKLIYFAQGHKLGEQGKVLFNNQIDAWDHGPVVAVVYSGFDKIIQNATDETVNHLNISPEDLELMMRVWDMYGGYTAKKLTDMTHMPQTPWSKVYRQGEKNVHIPTALIQEYFSKPENRLKTYSDNFESVPVTTALPEDWYDPEEDVVWEAYQHD